MYSAVQYVIIMILKHVQKEGDKMGRADAFDIIEHIIFMCAGPCNKCAHKNICDMIYQLDIDWCIFYTDGEQ